LLHKRGIHERRRRFCAEYLSDGGFDDDDDDARAQNASPRRSRSLRDVDATFGANAREVERMTTRPRVAWDN
jgi:hypothetical protein